MKIGLFKFNRLMMCGRLKEREEYLKLISQ